MALCVWLFLLTAMSAPAATRQASPPTDLDFPIYPAMRANVDFWTSIFTEFSKSQGVIHDTKNLGRIYDVIQLNPSGTKAAYENNKKTKTRAINRYRAILLGLSKGIPPRSKQEKRVVALFKKNAARLDFKIAAGNLRCQTGLRNQFKEGLIRSGAMLDAFKKTFQSHGLPLDLVYLPCVESSYNFKAYSKFGAAGIWQFTRSTGRQYMEIGYVVDERRDPYISTNAAARLLKKNYTALKDWPLAITAYNHGLAGMQRAKQSKGSYENIFKSYRSRSFKFASRNFYSEFIAARQVAKNPETYFGRLDYDKPVPFNVITTKGYLPIDGLSSRLKINARTIQSLNPSLRQPVFNGQKYIPRGFRLKLPADLNLADVHGLLASVYHARQKPSRFHRVQKGDTAGSIARIHSVNLNDLILANNLNRRATIYPGQNLRIPAKNEILSAKSKPAAVPVPSGKTKNRDFGPKPSAAGKTVEPSAESRENQAADTMDINPHIVTSNFQVIRTYQEKNRTIGVIQVEAQETLGHYADWLQVPTQEIRILNRLKYGKSIAIDQKIKLPLIEKKVPLFEAQRYEFRKEIEEDFFASFSIQGVDIYEVKNGDNIWTLCLNELDIPLWLLKKYNPDMQVDALKLRQKIKYPVISRQSAD